MAGAHEPLVTLCGDKSCRIAHKGLRIACNRVLRSLISGSPTKEGVK